MIEKILAEISSVYPLKEKDIGEFATPKVGPMKFSVRCFEAEGLGNVSVMKGKALFGLMVMDTVVINPFDRDMAMLSYDRIHVLKNDTLILEVAETRLGKKQEPIDLLSEIKERYADIPEVVDEPHWYDSLRWASSLKKKGKGSVTGRFDALVMDYIKKYVVLAAASDVCDRDEKRAVAKTYTDGLLGNGGPSTDEFVKVYGKSYTEKFYREVFFGV